MKQLHIYGATLHDRAATSDDAMDRPRNARYARAATLPFWEAAAARLPATRSQPMSQSVLTHLLTLLTANELRPKGLQELLFSLLLTLQRCNDRTL